MDLAGVCTTFIQAEQRGDVATVIVLLLRAASAAIKQGVRPETAPYLLRAIVSARSKSLKQTLLRVKTFMASDPLSLLDGSRWDPLCMALFMCECLLRVCFADVRDKEQVKNAFEMPDPPASEEFDRVLRQDEIRFLQAEFICGVDARGPTHVLRQDAPLLMNTSLLVCFEAVVVEQDDEDCLLVNNRVTREGIRLLERRSLTRGLQICIDAQITSRAENTNVPEVYQYENDLLAWFQHTVLKDANNGLLLRLDEWAVCTALAPLEAMTAAGEKGEVPQDYRNKPAVWLLQKCKTDAEYRRILSLCKKNAEHEENAYVAFSAMLEQHFNFDWLTRCFVALVNPAVALKKLAQYDVGVRSTSPPIVIQREAGRATLVSAHGRVECATACKALSAWIRHVEVFCLDGAYSRKTNVRDIVDRIKNLQVIAPLQKVSIGGDSFQV